MKKKDKTLMRLRKRLRKLLVNGTKHPIEHSGTFVDSVQLSGGGLVFHVFVGNRRAGR